MKRLKEPPKPPELRWNEEKKTLTLGGEGVLEYTMRWPKLEGKGRGVERLSQYYEKLAQVWRSRWTRELYCLACLELVRCRENSRPFHLWTANLTGEVALLEADCLSLRMEAVERRGEGLPTRVCTGDTWKWPDAIPMPLGSYFPKKHRWKGKVMKGLIQRSRERLEGGDCFFDQNFDEKLKKHFNWGNVCRREEGLEFYIPQCAIAPGAEGCPALLFPLDPL